MVASDGLNEQETTVVIYVRDLNDLPPVFENRTYEIEIVEESVFISTPLLKVFAHKFLHAFCFISHLFWINFNLAFP